MELDFGALAVTARTILAILGGATCVVGGVSAIAKMFGPIVNMKKEINANKKKLSNDFERMAEMERQIGATMEADKVICKSLLVLLDHEITGNGIDKLKVQRGELEQYLINRSCPPSVDVARAK